MNIRINDWVRNPFRHWRADVVAGLSLWGLVVPEALAYSGLAKVPAQAGLWTVVIALAVYSVLGRSSIVVASPTSATAATLGGIVTSLSTNKPAAVAAAVTLLVGVFFLLGFLLKAGFIVRLISRPVNTGFIFGLSLFVAVSQLSKVLGIHGAEGNVLERLWFLGKHIGETNVTALIVGCGAVAFLFLFPLLRTKLPAALLVLAIATAASAIFDFSGKFHVATVGKLPNGLPALSLPELKPGSWTTVAIGALGIALISLSEAVSVAEQAARARGEEYDANGDLLAYGAGNVLTSLAGGIVGGGSLSASSVNQSAGAKTQMSTAVASVAALCTILFLSGLLKSLPEAVLGALIIHAVAHHLVPRLLLRIREYSAEEFWMTIVAVVGVVLFDALGGLLIAMFINVALYVRTTYLTSVSEVGSVDGLARRVRLADHPAAKTVDGEIAIRVNNSLFFGNAQGATDAVLSTVDKAEDDHRKIHTVLLDLSGQAALDLTSASAIVDLVKLLRDRGMEVELVECREAVREDLARAAKLEGHTHVHAHLGNTPDDGEAK